ncbi:hypothetical protein [Salipiger mucosus]|uniref:Uncharacterized protein n=1 Tax=Salipiger mucosus DSM 16094 TaxID=1123237 RepID=S9Q5U0_9RHOB|nr:hypothetical protein [Salipiger mucosus]EPX76741.1 hypothetical protein Salmuc_04626 [Salipiger mucosus DSM 16094]
MKQAYTDVGLIEQDGEIFGLNLGWDSTAEHEFGLRGLKNALRLETRDVGNFRIDLPKKWRRTDAGVGKRMVTASREGVEFQSRLKNFGKATKTLPAETRLALVSGGCAQLLESCMTRKKTSYATPMPLEYRVDGERVREPMATSWAENGFVIRAFGDRERAFLKELHEAMLDGDLAVGLSGQQAFGGSGLTLVIVSKMPEEIGDLVLEQDIAEKQLQAAAEATGIHARLEEAGLGYHALAPEWTNFFKGESTMTSEYPVVFFLNPRDQQKNGHGWFTVEDLIAWTEGAGPVLKSEDALAP